MLVKGWCAVLWQCLRRGHGVEGVVYKGKLLPSAAEIVDIWKILLGRAQEWMNLLVKTIFILLGIQYNKNSNKCVFNLALAYC